MTRKTILASRLTVAIDNLITAELRASTGVHPITDAIAASDARVKLKELINKILVEITL